MALQEGLEIMEQLVAMGAIIVILIAGALIVDRVEGMRNANEKEK